MNEGKRTKRHSTAPPLSSRKRKASVYKDFGENSNDVEDDGKRKDRKRLKSSPPTHPSKKRGYDGDDGDDGAGPPTDPPAKNTRASWKTRAALVSAKTSHENSEESNPHATAKSKGKGKTKKPIQGRNATSKPDEKHNETFLRSKPNARKPITPRTSPPSATCRSSTAKSKPKDGQLLKTSSSAAGYLLDRKNTTSDLALVENRSRNSRESAPSPEPSPPLGTRAKNTRATAKTTTAPTALSKGSRALTPKKEAKQQTKDASARVTRSKGKVDIAQLSATNKAMPAKSFPKSFSNAPKMAESRMTKTKVSKPKRTPELAKTSGHANVTQPTVIVPSNSKPKKRSAFARRFSEHVRNAWMYADSY